MDVGSQCDFACDISGPGCVLRIPGWENLAKQIAERLDTKPDPLQPETVSLAVDKTLLDEVYFINHHGSCSSCWIKVLSPFRVPRGSNSSTRGFLQLTLF